MVQQRAFRKARGARGILDHHGIGRLDVGERDGLVVAGGDEGGPVVEADDLAKLRAARRDLAHRLQHRIAAERIDHEYAGRAGLLQHIFDFVGPEAGIDGDQHHAGEPGAEFQHDPFGQVLRPDRDPFARLEAAEQSARGALRFAVEFGIGPLAAQRRIGDAGNQCDPVRRGACGLFEQAAERDIAHRGDRRSRDVGYGQSHCSLPSRLFAELDQQWHRRGPLQPCTKNFEGTLRHAEGMLADGESRSFVRVRSRARAAQRE